MATRMQDHIVVGDIKFDIFPNKMILKICYEIIILIVNPIDCSRVAADALYSMVVQYPIRLYEIALTKSLPNENI